MVGLSHIKRSALAMSLIAAFASSWAQLIGPRQFANRVEGTKPVPTALAQFTLIALTRNAVHFHSNDTLYVRFFVPPMPLAQKDGIFLRALEREATTGYFMTAKNPPWKVGDWNVFGPWPTKDVIDILGIDAGNIGVLASYRDDNSGDVYLPIDLYEDSNQLSAHTYTLHFIAGRPLQSLDINVSNASGQHVDAHTSTFRCNKAFNPNCIWCAAGSVQAITFDISSASAGVYHVQLVGHVPGSLETISEDFALYHHP